MDRAALAREAIADFALALVRTPSPSGQEGAVASLVREQLSALGFDVAVDDWGNVIGTLDAGPGPCVLLDAHMDTVGVGDPARWTRDPAGERVGERLYGRGALDMKGPLAAAVHGAAALAGRLQRGRVVVSATVAEELVEGPALVRVAERVEPSVVIVCEPTDLRLARGQRGRLELQVEVRGRSTHSARPALGVNAAEGMADVLRALRALPAPQDPLLGAGELVVTDVLSSPYPGLSVVPDRCVATYDRRTLPGERSAAIVGEVERAATQALAGSGAEAAVSIARDEFVTYAGAAVSAPNDAPAWRAEDDAPHVLAALRGLAAAGCTAPLTHYDCCTNGSGSAGVLGIPTIGLGPGDPQLAHRYDEHVELAALATGAHAYAHVVSELLAIHDER